MVGIYRIISPVGKIYIGYSRNLTKREDDYDNKRCRGQRHLYSSLLKYGTDKHQFDTIEIVEDESQLEIRERYYYLHYKNQGYEMLNIVEPGEKGSRKHSEETKLLISKANIKFKVTQFTKEGKFIKVWSSGTEATKFFNLSRYSIFSVVNGTTKTSGGFVWRKGEILNDITPDLSRKISGNPRKKRKEIRLNNPVYQYSLDRKFMKEWYSMTVASEELKLNKRCISSVCRGRTKKTGGFFWSKTRI